MSEEQLDNGTAIGNIIENGDTEEVRMILGDREKIRYAGIIRAGVKIPKNSCTSQEKEQFKKLEAEGLPYDEIDRKIGGEPRSSKSKLFPTNTDHFVVRECDFKREADAEYIRKNFADPDGHVRRVPIWLAVGDLETIMPHNFRAFDGSGNVRAYSFYKGNDLMLRYAPKGIKGPVKKEDWKESPFDPDAPPADAPAVQFGGMYKVNIPGLKGVGEIAVPTRSWYGMGDGIAVLKRVRHILGRFDGLLNGEPFLELVKVAETVKTPDGKRQKQWVITVELARDPMELARHAEKVRERGPAAIAMLNGGTRHALPHSEPEPVAGPSLEPVPEPATEPQDEHPAVSERRHKIMTFFSQVAVNLKLNIDEIHDFVSFVNDGIDIDDLDDDALAKSANQIKTSMKNTEQFRADLLAAIGQ